MNIKVTIHQIGLFGYGTVGRGFHELILANPQLNINADKIVVKQSNKVRYPTQQKMSVQANDILNNANIETVVELINCEHAALVIARHVLQNGNNLISASKKMLSQNLTELIELEEQYGGCLLYEASSAASIPVIRLLDVYFANEEVHCWEGILNGTSNYILSAIFNQKLTYHTALLQAQEEGFAEADPLLDTGGFDALYKLTIINAHAFGVIVNPTEVFNYGIRHIHESDIEFARSHAYTIKQIAHAEANEQGKLLLYVAPQFVKNTDALSYVDAENNGFSIETAHSGKQFYAGKGAGAEPTGAAVLADVIASKRQKNYQYTKLKKPANIQYQSDLRVDVYLSYEQLVNINGLQIKVSEQLMYNERKIVLGSISLSELIKHKTFLEENNVSLIIRT